MRQPFKDKEVEYRSVAVGEFTDELVQLVVGYPVQIDLLLIR